MGHREARMAGRVASVGSALFWGCLIFSRGVGRLAAEFDFYRSLGCRDMLSAPEILNREFLEIRSKVLELAAAFDRLERADGSITDDARLARLREGLTVLLEQSENRAEQVQMIFSRSYDDAWLEKFQPVPR